mgnify:FL=1
MGIFAQDLVHQRQGVLRKLAGPGHDAGGDRGQVLPGYILVSGEREHGVGAAGIDDKRALAVRAQGQQVRYFLPGARQPAGLHVSLLHGGRYIEQNHQGGLVLAEG